MQDIPQELLNKAAEGDRNAFEQIYRAVSGFVYSVAFRVIQSREEAEEVTQDVFIKIHHNLAKFRGESGFKTWVYRITVNAALDAGSRAARRRQQNVEPAVMEEIAAVPPEVEKNMAKKAAQETVQRLLERLSPEQRSCLVLREIHGLSYEEIAKSLNANINTVRTRLKRAREALMAYAKQEVMGHEM